MEPGEGGVSESTFRTTFPPEGTSPTVSRPRATVEACEMLGVRLAEIRGELREAETKIRALLAEQATIEATIRVAGG